MEPIVESQQEYKVTKEILRTSLDKPGSLDQLLGKYDFCKVLKVTAWLNRFINNYRRRNRIGPLTNNEIKKGNKFWVQREQQRVKDTEKFKIDQERLDLQKNE